MKYVKKPVVIDAVEWTGDNLENVVKELDIPHTYIEPIKHRLAIFTLEGTMYAEKGDMIIKGVKGEVYPCKPDIFEATYSKVS